MKALIVVALLSVTLVNCDNMEAFCGIRGRSTYIVKGAEAEFSEFPWHVAIMIRGANFWGGPKDRAVCGGTIIASTLVLTAAHCFTKTKDGKIDHELYSVAAGLIDLDTVNDENRYKAACIHTHPNYEHRVNDVAIVRTEKSIYVDPVQTPICLQRPPLIEAWKNGMKDVHCILPGWGSKDHHPIKKLRYSELIVHPVFPCPFIRNTTGISFKTLPDNTTPHFCTRVSLSSRSGDVDNGGGLVCWIERRYHIVGVASFRTWNEKNHTQSVSGFAAVPTYSEWMSTIMASTGC